jgi:hypothetical protein
MSTFGIQVWPNGTATLLLDDYRLAIWESDRIDEEGRTTTDWELLRSGKRIYQDEGPSSGANGFGFDDMGDAMASLVSFLYAEDERQRHNSPDGSLFPDATPELIAFIEMHAEDASIAGYEWENPVEMND